MRRDLILSENLADVKEIRDDDSLVAFTYLQPNILRYLHTFSAGVVSINHTELDIFINNILNNCECTFDYVIEDFNGKSGVATLIYKNHFIYYTAYDDVFSNPYDYIKIKVDNILIHKLRNL